MSSKILATVGALTVTDDEVTEFIMGLGQRGQMYNTPEGRRAILNQIIGNKLLLLDAKRNLLEAEPAFKAELKRTKEMLLTNYAIEKAIGNVRVTDDEAKKYYDENPEQFMGDATVNASHILVADEETAKNLLEQVRKAVAWVISVVARWFPNSIRLVSRWRLVSCAVRSRLSSAII